MEVNKQISNEIDEGNHGIGSISKELNKPATNDDIEDVANRLKQLNQQNQNESSQPTMSIFDIPIYLSTLIPSGTNISNMFQRKTQTISKHSNQSSSNRRSHNRTNRK